MRIKIVKCEAQNAVNIGNISKFCNEAADDFKLMDAGHDLFRGSLDAAILRGLVECCLRRADVQH